MDQRLIIFLKYPEEGKVKMRLASSIGAHEATCVYKKLAEDTVSQVRPLAGRFADIVIAYDPPERRAEIEQWIPGPFKYVPQEGSNLGERLKKVVNAAFLEGAHRVVLIGSDCAELDVPTVSRAFLALSKKDLAVGPAKDGGYYLIGLKRDADSRIFNGIPWSTPEVLRMTLKRAREAGLSYELLPEKRDIDTLEDLAHLAGSEHDPVCSGQTVSVILPALNEEKGLEAALLNLIKNHHPDEIIVADGGSTDRTLAIASRYAKVVRSKKGRASQMNAGAQVAKGNLFLFLHADTTLPAGALKNIRETLLREESRSGRFRMIFGHPHPLLRFFQFYTRFHFFSYGDQGFFVTKELFHKMGGFDENAPFEDIDFYRRLRKLDRPVILSSPVITSPRRFLKNGIIRQKLINIILVSMHYLGLKPAQIAHFYKKWYS